MPGGTQNSGVHATSGRLDKILGERNNMAVYFMEAAGVSSRPLTGTAYVRPRLPVVSCAPCHQVSACSGNFANTPVRRCHL